MALWRRRAAFWPRWEEPLSTIRPSACQARRRPVGRGGGTSRSLSCLRRTRPRVRSGPRPRAGSSGRGRGRRAGAASPPGCARIGPPGRAGAPASALGLRLCAVQVSMPGTGTTEDENGEAVRVWGAKNASGLGVPVESAEAGTWSMDRSRLGGSLLLRVDGVRGVAQGRRTWIVRHPPQKQRWRFEGDGGPWAP